MKAIANMSLDKKKGLKRLTKDSKCFLCCLDVKKLGGDQPNGMEKANKQRTPGRTYE